jgi:predicted glycosyltransferase
MTAKQILAQLKALKEGESIDLVNLPELTREETAVFESRDTKGSLQRLLKQKGYAIEDDAQDSKTSP